MRCVHRKDDFIAAFFYKLVYLFGFEVHATANHAVFVYLELVGSAERHDFIARFDRKTGKVFGAPSDHLNSMFLKPGYWRVSLVYALTALISPPSVPLIPCLE